MDDMRTTGSAQPKDAWDLATIARDDVLLTALGRDEPAPNGDEVAEILAAWRSDVASDQPPMANVSDSTPQSLPKSAPAPSPRRRGFRPARGLIAAAAAVILLATGAALAAGQARPGSPLWPITTIVYGERADSLIAQQDAERAIQQARESIADGRYTEAAGLLDVATVRAGAVRDEAVSRRLLEEIAAVRGLLPGGVGLTATPGVSTPAKPSTPVQPAPTPGPTPAPTTKTGGALPLPLPSLPLPPLPLPTLPTLPLPTLSLPPLLP